MRSTYRSRGESDIALLQLMGRERDNGLSAIGAAERCADDGITLLSIGTPRDSYSGNRGKTVRMGHCLLGGPEREGNLNSRMRRSPSRERRLMTPYGAPPPAATPAGAPCVQIALA